MMSSLAMMRRPREEEEEEQPPEENITLRPEPEEEWESRDDGNDADDNFGDDEY